MILALAIPVAIFHANSFNAEFDYWAGTLALVVFAVIETILFAWVFGIDAGWAELNKGAELKIPRVFYYIIKYVTPVFLLLILSAYIFQPKGEVVVKRADGEVVRESRNWEPYLTAPFTGRPLPTWEWSGDGMIGKLLHKDLKLPPDAPPEKVRFTEQLKFVRNIDRLSMVGVFAGLTVLVSFAWRKRAREGRL